LFFKAESKMKAFIYGQKWSLKYDVYIKQLFNKLSSSGIEYKVFKNFNDQIQSSNVRHDTLSTHEELRAYRPDVVITLGGDGTILSAMTMIRELELPIMGLNLGRLGFLASIEQERIDEAIEMYLEGRFTISKRSMLQIASNPEIFGDINYALNDFTILKRDNSSMIVLHTYIDGDFLNSYWADGLIVSTPTGSTGYSLSCGGPIMFPSSDNFILTPVAPHNLNVRPIVISSNHELSFKIEGRSENFLCTMDSRYEVVTSEHDIKIKKNNFSTHLISLEGDNFMTTLRSKLNWGIDKRN